MVTIRNISINGIGSGVNGVRFVSGKALHIEHCTIASFTNHGIDIEPSAGGGQAFVQDTVSRDNGGSGISGFPRRFQYRYQSTTPALTITLLPTAAAECRPQVSLRDKSEQDTKLARSNPQLGSAKQAEVPMQIWFEKVPEGLSSYRRPALLLGHPGHELKVLGWLAENRPRVYVLTDGSGFDGASL